jgi:hypothetical protein
MEALSHGLLVSIIILFIAVTVLLVVGLIVSVVAKELRVHESTVRADLREDPALSAGKSRTGSVATKAEKRAFR